MSQLMRLWYLCNIVTNYTWLHTAEILLKVYKFWYDGIIVKGV